MPEQTKLVIWVLAPTSPLIFDLVIDPAAGRAPGMKDPARFATPKATNSLFGLMEYWNFAALYFADTMLSKKPIMDANLVPAH